MSEKRAVQLRDADKERLVEEWRDSGQTQAEFAKTHGINHRTFQSWSWEVRKRQGARIKRKPNSCRFVEVSPSTPEEATGRGMCRITMSNTEIEFSSSSDAAWIAEILSKLGHGR